MTQATSIAALYRYPVKGLSAERLASTRLRAGETIPADRLYAVGWARRGPTGTIGTNRPDGYEVADQIAQAMPAASSEERPGADGLKRLLESRGAMPTDYEDWRKIEETEVARARPGSPREKFVRHEEWLQALGR